jgi:hypothetical protein
LLISRQLETIRGDYRLDTGLDTDDNEKEVAYDLVAEWRVGGWQTATGISFSVTP